MRDHLGPICIVTSSGMQCMSSPIRTHKPFPESCFSEPDADHWTTDMQEAQEAEIQDVADAIFSALKPDHRRTLDVHTKFAIGKVAYLMARCEVLTDGYDPFTIIKAGIGPYDPGHHPG